MADAMGHDHHFLSRLDRVSQETCDLALGLYRDHELVHDILNAMAVSVGSDRVAIGLAPGDTPPYAIVARDGHFVTCLSEGMQPFDVPLVSHAQLGSISNEVKDLRTRMQNARDKAKTNTAFAATLNLWSEVSREDMFMAFGFRELVRKRLSEALVMNTRVLRKTVSDAVVAARGGNRTQHRCRAFLKLVGALAQIVLFVSASEVMRVSGALPGKSLAAYETILELVACFKTSAIGLRAVWSACTYSEFMLWRCEQIYANSLTTDEMVTSTLVLLGIALREPKWRSEVTSILAHAPGRRGIWRHVYAELKPDLDRALSNDAGQREETAKEAWELLKGFTLPGHMSAFSGATPGRLAEPLVLPTLLYEISSISRYVSCIGFAVRTLPYLVNARPEDMYFPRELLVHFRRRPPNKELRLLLDEVVDTDPDHETAKSKPAPGPNEPCRCGSGKKSKKCCDNPSAAKPQPSAAKPE